MSQKSIAVMVVAALIFVLLSSGCGGGSGSGEDEVWTSSVETQNSWKWNNRIRDLIIDGSRLIPYDIGEGISFMLSLLWPKGEADIWSQIVKDIEATIDREIVKNVIRERQSELDALVRNIESYSNATRLTEKGNYLSICLAKSVDLFYKITNDEEHDAQLVPLAVSLAGIHISLLRERYEHGDKLYPNQINKDPMWLNEMLKFYDEYILYFYGHNREGDIVQLGLVHRWAYYRKNLLVTKQWTEAGIPKSNHATLTDKYYSEDPYVVFQSPDGRDKDVFKKYLADVHIKIMTSETLKFADEVMINVAILCRMLPEGSHPDAGKDSFRIYRGYEKFIVGPFAFHTTKNKNKQRKQFDVCSNLKWVVYDEQPGTLYQIIVQSWNALDGLQFVYSDGYKGKFIGNPDGGARREDIIRPDGDYFTGFDFRFVPDKYLQNIKFFTSKHETEWMAGRHVRPENYEVDEKNGYYNPKIGVRAKNYEVVGAGFEYDSAQRTHGNINCMSVRYIFRNPPTDDPEQIDP